MERVAVVDVGSNTVKLAVYSVDREKTKINEIYKESVYARLLNHVDKDGFLTEEGFLKARIALEGFKEKISFFNPDRVIPFATFVVRTIKNRDDFVKRLYDLFEVEILSGEQEAYYSTLGALLDVRYKSFLAFDIGGGSLELSPVINRKIKFCKSYPLGTLEFKECILNGVYDVSCIRQKVRKEVSHTKKEFGDFKKLVGIGGSIRAIKKIVKKRKLKKKVLKKAISDILRSKPLDLTVKYKIPMERTKTLLSASVVALELMNIFKCEDIVISKYGIREGIIFERVLNDEKRENRYVESKTSNK